MPMKCLSGSANPRLFSRALTSLYFATRTPLVNLAFDGQHGALLSVGHRAETLELTERIVRRDWDKARLLLRGCSGG